MFFRTPLDSNIDFILIYFQYAKTVVGYCEEGSKDTNMHGCQYCLMVVSKVVLQLSALLKITISALRMIAILSVVDGQ
jgi:hypothetical protein